MGTKPVYVGAVRVCWVAWMWEECVDWYVGVLVGCVKPEVGLSAWECVRLVVWAEWKCVCEYFGAKYACRCVHVYVCVYG